MGLLTVGCVQHETRAEPGVGAPGTLLIDDRVVEAWQQPQTGSGPLPQHRDLTVVRYDQHDDGSETLRRADAVLATGTPWWQRFPMDLFSDLLWPGTITVPATMTLAPLDPISYTPTELDALAIQHGYGTAPTVPTPHNAAEPHHATP